MKLQEIEVEIDKSGRVTIRVSGARGTECLGLTQALEQALGGEIEAREMTAGFHDTAEQVPEKRRERIR